MTNRTNLELASEALWDFAEGKIDSEALGMWYQRAMGWADTGSVDEREACLRMAGRIADMLEGTK